jgi:hypothetical protein
MPDIIDVLRSIGEIEHWTRRPIRDAPAAWLSSPPIVTWRYLAAPNELVLALQQAVSTFPGVIKWDLLITGRNWCLMPSRIREHAELHGYPGDLRATEELAAMDPEFGKRANLELGLLARHIEDCLKR